MTQNGNGTMNGSWKQVLIKYGFATAVASYLIYLLSGTVVSGIQDIKAQTMENATSINQLRTEVGESTRVLRQICINTAQEKSQLVACSQ